MLAGIMLLRITKPFELRDLERIASGLVQRALPPGVEGDVRHVLFVPKKISGGVNFSGLGMTDQTAEVEKVLLGGRALGKRSAAPLGSKFSSCHKWETTSGPPLGIMANSSPVTFPHHKVQ